MREPPRDESTMIGGTFCPPVLIVAFNRPDTTELVFNSLREVRPAQLFFAVDGSRSDRKGEPERVEQVRRLVSTIDWDCDIKTLFRTDNLGCKLGVSGAISWFFDHVEAGIILEDDCVADPSFFRYASELLDRFQDDERILMISGDNFLQGQRNLEHSYYFSRYAHIWGWATWRRAWKHYDHEMKAWPRLRESASLKDVLGDRQAACYWSNIFEDTFQNRNTSWAYRWQFCVWAQNGLTVLPRCNLVSNIGFGETATHTKEASNPWASMPVEPMLFPMCHPLSIARNEWADGYTQRTVFPSQSAWGRLLVKCRAIAGRAAVVRNP